MNGDEGGYGVSFDPGHDVKRKKPGGYSFVEGADQLPGIGGIEPAPMDTGWAGGWGTDFTPDPGIPDPIVPPQTPPVLPLRSPRPPHRAAFARPSPHTPCCWARGGVGRASHPPLGFDGSGCAVQRSAGVSSRSEPVR